MFNEIELCGSITGGFSITLQAVIRAEQLVITLVLWKQTEKVVNLLPVADKFIKLALF